MEYRRLGRSGLNISKLALGTMNFGNPTDKTEAFEMIQTALDAGINILDCADVYADDTLYIWISIEKRMVLISI